MAPKGGRKIKAHFDRAEAQDPDAEARAKLSELSEFLARRIRVLMRGDPDLSGPVKRVPFHLLLFFWASKEK